MVGLTGRAIFFGAEVLNECSMAASDQQHLQKPPCVCIAETAHVQGDKVNGW